MNRGAPSTVGKMTGVLERPFFQALLVLIVGFLAYSNTFHGPIQWDGVPTIVENPLIRDLGNFLTSDRGYQANPRRFIGMLSFALNYRLGGDNVVGYHLVNLLIHLANALLVYLLAALTFKTPFMGSIGQSAEGRAREDSPCAMRHAPSSHLIALFSALLFVAHPLQTQAVAYVYQRFTSLATFFYLLALVLYIKGRLVAAGRDENNGRLSFGPALLFFGATLVSAVLAMKTKEIAFTLPFAVILYEFTFFKISFRKKLLFLAPVALTLVIVPLSILHSDKSVGELLADVSAKTRLQTDMSRWDYLMTELRVIVTYVRLLFVPMNQNVDYDYPVYHSLLTPSVLLSFLFLLSLAGLGCRLLYSSRSGSVQPPSRAPYERLIGFGIIWFFLTLSVESSVIPIVDVIFEHRVYLPSVGFFLAASTALLLLAQRPGAQKIVLASFCSAVLVFTGATFARNHLWMNMISLWSDTVKKSPNKARTHFNLGQAYYDAGLMQESLKEYQAAVTIKPDDADAHNNLGSAYSKLNRNDEAIREFRTAIVLRPKDASAHNNLGAIYATKGLHHEAMEEFKAAITLQPDFAQAHFNLGMAYSDGGRGDEAVSEFRTAVNFAPDYTDALFSLGRALMNLGRLDEAAGAFQALLRYKPDDVESHLNLGNIHFNKNLIDEAAREFQIAVQYRPDYEEAHNNLGIAYYRLGRLDDAIREFQLAININPADKEARANLENLTRAVKGMRTGP
jgi:tetratricopeptide (TPR) repeat protein